MAPSGRYVLAAYLNSTLALVTLTWTSFSFGFAASAAFAASRWFMTSGSCLASAAEWLSPVTSLLEAPAPDESLVFTQTQQAEIGQKRHTEISHRTCKYYHTCEYKP